MRMDNFFFLVYIQLYNHLIITLPNIIISNTMKRKHIMELSKIKEWDWKFFLRENHLAVKMLIELRRKCEGLKATSCI